MLNALEMCKRTLFSGFQDEKSEGRKGLYTEAFKAADAAIQKAKGVTP
jgi:hypothetical protein